MGFEEVKEAWHPGRRGAPQKRLRAVRNHSISETEGFIELLKNLGRKGLKTAEGSTAPSAKLGSKGKYGCWPGIMAPDWSSHTGEAGVEDLLEFQSSITSQ